MSIAKTTVNRLFILLGLAFFVLPTFFIFTPSVKAVPGAGNVNTVNNNVAGNNNSVNAVIGGGVGSLTVKLPEIKDPFNGNSLSEVVLQLIRIVFLLIIMAAVIVIVIAGFRMVASGSNPQELAKAKKAIVWAIIGLLLALMSYSIVEIITRIF